MHIDFPADYEVLRGELVDLEAPQPKRIKRTSNIVRTLKAITLTASFFLPEAAIAEGNTITLPAQTLICDTPLDYYGAFDGISMGKISVSDPFPKTLHNCLWTDRIYRAHVIMVAPYVYLAEVRFINPSEDLSIVRGWVGMSEVNQFSEK